MWLIPTISNNRSLSAPKGVFFLGDGFPMALPWAGREVPLTGRQIVNHPENSDKRYHRSGGGQSSGGIF